MRKLLKSNMRKFLGKTFIFFLLPLFGNFVLGVAAFFFNAADFTSLWITYLTILTSLLGSLVCLIGFRLHDIGPRQMLMSFVAQSAALILIFGAIYRGQGLLYGGKKMPLLDDGASALYFSIITWTTLGYGDFTPAEELRLVAGLEALLGYFFFGISVGLGTAVLCDDRANESPERTP